MSIYKYFQTPNIDGSSAGCWYTVRAEGKTRIGPFHEVTYSATNSASILLCFPILWFESAGMLVDNNLVHKRWRYKNCET